MFKHKIVGPSHFEIFQPSRAFIDVNLRDKVWRVLVSYPQRKRKQTRCQNTHSTVQEVTVIYGLDSDCM